MSRGKVVTVIQARCGSSRLPGKVLMELCGKSLLARQFERVARSQSAGTIVVATTLEREDDAVANICEEEKIHCFRGHTNDLLDRHYRTGKLFEADAIVKIPSDCPLIDPKIIDDVVSLFLENSNLDYVSNLHPASFPDGNDVEIMTAEALETAWLRAVRPLEREHTTPFLWENPELFKIGNYLWKDGPNFSQSHRFTIDYPEDYAFISAVYNELFPNNPDFNLKDILGLLLTRPDIYKLNQVHAGEYWYKNHRDELKTIHYQDPGPSSEENGNSDSI